MPLERRGTPRAPALWTSTPPTRRSCSAYPFASPEDIMRVSGIGEKKFERMRAMIRV